MEGIRNQYRYEDLDFDNREFRIIELLPGAREDIVKGRLTRHSLDTPPPYDAVSYTWGDTKVLSQIQIDDDASFNVPVNTERALRDMRLIDRSRFLWIDSVCINQHDIPERNNQVMHMRYIYAHATLVRSWLDLAIDLQSPAFTKLASLTSQSTVEDLGDDPLFWEPVSQIYREPYWSRIWVQQELHLAKRGILHCRENNVSAESMVLFEKLHREQKDILRKSFKTGEFISWIFLTGLRPIESYRLAHFEDSMGEAVSSNSSQPYMTLLDALHGLRGCGCTDPRDRVYACLGLIRNLGAADIEVDYASSVENVYLKVVQVILTYDSLDFLSHVAHNMRSKANVASWIPDWGALFNEAQIRAEADNIPVEVRELPHILNDNCQLRVYGFCIGRVVQAPRAPAMDDYRNERSVAAFEGPPQLVPFRVLEEACKMRNSVLGRNTISRLARKLLKPSWDPEDIIALLRAMELSTNRTKVGEIPGPSTVEVADGLLKFLRAAAPDPTACKRNEEVWLRTLNQTEEQRLAFADVWLEHWKMCSMNWFNSNFLIDDAGKIGLGPDCAAAGDEVWIIFKCRLPITLRRQGNEYTVQGPAYLSRCMDGEPFIGMPPVVEVGQRYGQYLIEEITLC